MEPVFVIAEAGVNHNGDLGAGAEALQDAARGPPGRGRAVKFQSFRAEDLAVKGAPTADYQKKQTGEDDQFSMLRKLELSPGQHERIRDHCNAIGIEFFSTPFSLSAVDMLVALGVRRIKMPSGELRPHRALVEHACATGLARAAVHRNGDAGGSARGPALGAGRARLARGHLRPAALHLRLSRGR